MFRSNGNLIYVEDEGEEFLQKLNKFASENGFVVYNLTPKPQYNPFPNSGKVLDLGPNFLKRRS